MWREEQRIAKDQPEPILQPIIFPANFDNAVPRWVHCRVLVYLISLSWLAQPIMKLKGPIVAPYAAYSTITIQALLFFP